MKALVYTDKDKVSIQERPKPTIQTPTEAIVKIKHTTICGTDLHIIKGDVPTAPPGRVLGHEGVGVIDEVGASVPGFQAGDTVLINCVTVCALCGYCRRGMHSQCESGGWSLGNKVDGTQAEYVRIQHASSSLQKLPGTIDLKDAVMLSDAMPTGMECGVLNGRVQPGNSVVIIGAGAIGLAVTIAAQFYSPATLVVADLDNARLEKAREFGATHTVNTGEPDGTARLMELTEGGCGYDTVVEAVGIPATFELCQELVAPGGTIANVGVHGGKVDLHLERLWDKNIAITTRLVDTSTTPMLLRLFQAGKLDNVSKLVTHQFSLDEAEKAYEVFKNAADHKALKVLINL